MTTNNNINWKAIKRARIERNLSQRDLALAVGCTQSAVAHMERGHLRPGPALATRIGGVLGEDPRNLFGVDALRRKGLR
jgi:transcriptional regulator with XRE-family HTH domain